MIMNDPVLAGKWTLAVYIPDAEAQMTAAQKERYGRNSRHAFGETETPAAREASTPLRITAGTNARACAKKKRPPSPETRPTDC